MSNREQSQLSQSKTAEEESGKETKDSTEKEKEKKQRQEGDQQSPSPSSSTNSNIFGRFRQRLGELIGANTKTEYDATFRNKLRFAETTKAYCEELVKNTHQIMWFKMEKYERLATSLQMIGQLQIDQPKHALSWETAAEVHMVTGREEEQLRVELVKALEPIQLYVEQEYPQLREEKHRLTRRRLEMDDAKNRMQNTKKTSKLQTLTRTHQLATRNFDRQAEKVGAMLDEIPRKVEQWRTTMEEVLHMEKTYHQNVANKIQEALAILEAHK